jgi:hypothetical protein
VASNATFRTISLVLRATILLPWRSVIVKCA